MESQISEYNSKLLQRNGLAANSSEKNPWVVDRDVALEAMRKSIISSIDNLMESQNVQMSTLKNIEKESTSRIAANPSQAKYLLSVERQQKIFETLYLFLLQKREENELSKAFTAYNSRTITPPHGSSGPIAPVRNRILMIAFVIGLLVPIVIIFLKEILNTKVRGRKDLDGLGFPLIGEIPSYGRQKSRLQLLKKVVENEKLVVVKEGKRDVINEAFRVLRTNLEFMTEKSAESNVLLVTSFNPGSGKSFLSMNIAESLAIKGKRVLAIDGDMRHSSLSAYINSPKVGLSDYLAHKVDKLSDIVMKTDHHKNLSVIPTGTTPPNPTELLFDDRFAELITTVRKQYDYVFIDCPPIEIVADTQIIEKFVDRTLFVVRAGLLERSMLSELRDLYEEQKYKNISVILHGTESKGSRYGYLYGYRIGYGSNYHYATEEK